jgi:PAS domain S-box-containing protein
MKKSYVLLGNAGHGQRTSDAPGDLDDIGLRELLEHDPRPTFIIDLLHAPTTPPIAAISEPIFCNKSFQSHAEFSGIISGRAGLDSIPVPGVLSYTDFKSWALNVNDQDDANNPIASPISYAGVSWTRFTIRRRWRVISGSYGTTDSNTTSGNVFADRPVLGTEEMPNTKAEPDPLTPIHFIHSGASFLISYVQTTGTPDWTDSHPVGELSPHIQFARSVDWAATPLGAISTWPRELRQIANLLMGNPLPCALFWGEELTSMYNQAYAERCAGYKHPGLMGTGLSGPFKEIWSSIEGMFAECRRTGKAVVAENQMLSIERHGFLEETFFSWTLTPLYGGGPNILGFYNSPFETTRQMLNDRRTRTLLRLGEEVALAQNVSTFWARVLKGIEGNEFDFPFALLYSVLNDPNLDNTSSISSEGSNTLRCYVLEGALGVPEGHKAAPTRVDIDDVQGGFSLAFRDAVRTGKPGMIQTVDGSLSESLIEGFSWRGFGEPCKEAVVCPIRPTTGENVLGFLIIGINPRRPYDEDYQRFIQLLNRQLAASLASVTLFEEEIRRGHIAAEAAALEQQKLSKELAVQTSRLQRIAEVSPVGMFSIDTNGLLIEANDRWYSITGHPKEDVCEMSWMNAIDDSSLSVAEDGWHRLTVDCMPWSAEVRLKKPWQDPITGEFLDHWVLAESQPEFSEDGSIRSIIGSVTDITIQKRSAENALARARLSEQLLLRTQEAKENEKNFKRFSDLAPGGLVVMDADGKITYANSQWFEISGHPNDRSVLAASLSWTKAISEEDLPYFASKWEEMKTNHVTITMEVRMQKPWDGQLGGTLLRRQRWILASMFPEVSEDGILMSVMGCE